jgi:hypothetical protein
MPTFDYWLEQANYAENIISEFMKSSVPKFNESETQ